MTKSPWDLSYEDAMSSIENADFVGYEDRIATTQKNNARQSYLNSLSTSWNSATIGRVLLYHGVEFKDFNDVDFLKLAFAPDEPYGFLGKKQLNDVCESFSAVEIGRFFATLDNEFFKMWEKQIETSGRRLGRFNREYDEWVAKEERLENFHKMFLNLLNNVLKYPNTPIELLAELI